MKAHQRKTVLFQFYLNIFISLKVCANLLATTDLLGIAALVMMSSPAFAAIAFVLQT